MTLPVWIVVLLCAAAAGLGLLLSRVVAARGGRRVAARALQQLENETTLAWLATLPDGALSVSPPLRDLIGTDIVARPLTLREFVSTSVHPEDRARIDELFAEFLARARAFEEGEVRIECADGHYHRFALRAAVSWGSDGRPYLLLGSLLDLTRTREIEEERDRLFNLSVDLLGISDFGGNLQQVNPAWVRVLRWSRDDVMARPLTDFIHAEDRAEFLAYLGRLRSGETVRDLELRAQCRDGTYRWISWSSFPLPDRQRIFTVARDVTEKKEAETRLQAYQTRLRNLATELATVEDRERRQLAEILHDSLAQDLFAARAKVTLLKYPERLTDAPKIVTDTISILDQTMIMTRGLTFELFPPALYEVGLDAALEWLCRNFHTTRGLVCKLMVEGTSSNLPQDVRALAYRVVRELLANIHKHAQASCAEVAVRYGGGELSITVDDDGKVFDPEAEPGQEQPDPQKPQSGFGLFSIRERLRSLAGNLAIEASPLGGWRVVMTLPLVESDG